MKRPSSKKGSKSWTVRAHPDPSETRTDASFTAWMYEGLTTLVDTHKVPFKDIVALGIEAYYKGNVAPKQHIEHTLSDRFSAIDSMLVEIQRQLQSGVLVSADTTKSKSKARKVAETFNAMSEQLSRALDVFSADSEGDYDD